MADSEEKPKDLLGANTDDDEEFDEEEDEFEGGVGEDGMFFEEDGNYPYEEDAHFEEELDKEGAGETEEGEEQTGEEEAPPAKGSPKSVKRSASGGRSRSPSPKKQKTDDAAEGDA